MQDMQDQEEPEEPEQDDKESGYASPEDIHILKKAVAALEEANTAILGEVHALKAANAAFSDQVGMLESDSLAQMQ